MNNEATGFSPDQTITTLTSTSPFENASDTQLQFTRHVYTTPVVTKTVLSSQREVGGTSSKAGRKASKKSKAETSSDGSCDYGSQERGWNQTHPPKMPEMDHTMAKGKTHHQQSSRATSGVEGVKESPKLKEQVKENQKAKMRVASKSSSRERSSSRGSVKKNTLKVEQQKQSSGSRLNESSHSWVNVTPPKLPTMEF